MVAIAETSFLPIELKPIGNLDLEKEFFIGLFLCSIIVVQIIQKNRNLIKLFKKGSLQDEVEARIAAERKLAKLQEELEQKILARTAALGMANHDLQESASLMEKVANLTPNILYIYDLQQRCNVYSNRFIGEVLGYSESEIEQKNVQLFGELLHPDDRDLIAEHHQNWCTNPGRQ